MGVESFLKCPGLERALAIVPELFVCPDCGAEIEIWTDERRARCGRCSKLVSRENANTVDIAHEQDNWEKSRELDERDGINKSAKADSSPIPVKL